MPKNKIKIISNSQVIKNQKQIIKQLILKVCKKASKFLIFSKTVTVIIQEAKQIGPLKDLNGIGGYCPKDTLVEISLDVNHPSVKRLAKKAFERSLFHELHHAVRRQLGIDISNGSFFECLWSEGLADRFVFDMTGKVPIWATNSKVIKSANLFKKAKRIFNQPITDKNYGEWFLRGSKKKGIPRWAGYTIGYQMVKLYLKSHPDLDWNDITKINSEEIIKELI